MSRSLRTRSGQPWVYDAMVNKRSTRKEHRKCHVQGSLQRKTATTSHPGNNVAPPDCKRVIGNYRREKGPDQL